MKKQFIVKASEEAKQKINSASTHEYYETLEHPYEEEVLGHLDELEGDLQNLYNDITFFLHEGKENYIESESYNKLLDYVNSSEGYNNIVDFMTLAMDAMYEVEDLLKED